MFSVSKKSAAPSERELRPIRTGAVTRAHEARPFIAGPAGLDRRSVDGAEYGQELSERHRLGADVESAD